MKLHNFILLGLVILTALIPTSAQTWGVIGLSGSGSGSVACSGTGDLGTTSTGGSQGSSEYAVGQYTASCDICATKGHSVLTRGGAGQEAKMLIVSDNEGVPDTVLACSAAVALPSSQSNVEFTFSTSYQITNGTTYWLIMITSAPGTNMVYQYAAGSVPRYTLTSFDFTNCTITPNASSTTRDITMWVSDD